KGPQDRARINLNEPYELRYWMKEFAVSEAELRELVEEHGTSVVRVRKILRN
ncbi:MAG TPA: DUF3606 domain-containing protein, partial [Xanthobacteraceae bacterium]|nr:DUF3606 domain-containing protein [Xanthobacteraceae bacterium]